MTRLRHLNDKDLARVIDGSRKQHLPDGHRDGRWIVLTMRTVSQRTLVCLCR